MRPIYKNPSYSFDERAADLVSRMTLAQKASQTDSNTSPAIPSLGVPSYGWWNEALHGVAELSQTNNANAGFLQNTTSYPINQALGATFDPDLEYQISSNISDEAREVMPSNSENLDFYSPTMNIERDPRWGRNDESWGEDPLLESKLVSPFVDGMEGKDASGQPLAAGDGFHKTITTLKHYTANNSEVNRLNGDSVEDARTLREFDTKPFGDVVQASHPGSIMSSYNDVNGTPSPANAFLMQTLARETFGFNGYFTSDCDATYEITNGHHFQPPGWTRPINPVERNGYAMATGEDLDCNTGYHDNYNYLNSVPTDTQQGIKTETDTFNTNDLDTSAVRLFTARMETGEFNDPLSVPWVTQARTRVPSWTNGNANNAVTETPDRLALARKAADESLVLLKNQNKLLPLKPPSSGAYKVAVIGYFANPSSMYLGGYSSIQGAAGAAKEVNGYNGIKSAITAIDPDATVDYYKGFTDTGTRANQLLTVDPAAVAAAGKYDAVVVYAGTDSSTATEDHDRTTLQLPGAQNQLIQQVSAANPNTVVYMETVGPIDVSPFEATVGALVYSSYNGMRKGEALADVLLGKYDPSGHLPSTWYLNDAQMPAVTDYSIRPSATSNGRTYQYFTGQTRYPFGYGLSYTTFKDSGLQLSGHALTADDTLKATVTVTNTGTTAGSDTVQLYVNQPNAPASAERPIKRLEGFQRVTLDPGASTTVTIPVKVSDLAFWDTSAGKWVVDDGTYDVQIADSSADADIQQQDTVTVTVSGAITPKPDVLTTEPVVAGADKSRDIQQRVFFTAGQTIDPQPTVSMNDATLYGYKLRGQSTDFPSGMTFKYTSNHPEVVSVDGAGTLRTVADGVATVTADVTYGGVTKSTSFVVDVVSQLNDLTVNGQPLSTLNPGHGFAPDTYSYDVVLPAGSGAPVVAGTSADPNATVAVTQASGVPGSAKVVSTGADGTPYTYTVNFAYPVQSDEFNGSAPGPQWTWVRNDPTAESESGGALNITAQTGDLNAATNTAKNLLLQPALGDWAAETKMTLSTAPHTANQQSGLIAYQDDDNYIKLDWEFTGTSAQLVETSEDFSFTPNAPETAAFPTVLASLPTAGIVNGTTLYLKLVKSGQRYQSYYSTDGSTWTPFYEVGGSLTNVKVGLFSYNRAGTSTDLSTAFDYFRVGNTSVATGPVGGSVPPTLSLSLGSPASFGPFTPGVAKDYTSSMTANVVSSAGDATLSVADPATTATGHLVNGSFSLPSPLQASATSAAGAGGTAAPIGGSSNPLALLSYAGPVSNDPVSIAFGQHISAGDALRTGSYSKTLTFTLSTDQP